MPRNDGAMFEFVRRPPVVVEELAAALAVSLSDLFVEKRFVSGYLTAFRLSAAVDRVAAEYDWDSYHEAPIASAQDLLERQLFHYAVGFAVGRRAAEIELQAVYGAPVHVAGYRRYGPFYVGDGNGDGFTLEWFLSTPDWALPPVDEAARVRAVEGIAARVALAASAADLEAALEEVPEDVGITASTTRLWFQPAMPASDLARALGHPTAVAQTVGVHMSSWVLATVVGDHTSSLRVGCWRAEAELRARASGAEVPGVDVPAAMVAFLGSEDVVSQVEFTDR